MRMTSSRGLVLSAAVFLTLAAPAPAASVLTPVDGATVPARPTFTFDFAKGFAGIELSRSAALQASGPSAGEFVDRSDDVIGFVTNGRLKATAPIDAGTYYWHARVAADDPSNPARALGPWSALRRMTVADEPPDFLGWTIQAAIAKHNSACSSRVRLRGKVSYEDNDADPRIRFRMRISSGGHLLVTRTVSLNGKDHFDTTFCSRHRKLKVSPQILDKAGHVTKRGSRTIHVRS